MYEPPFSEFLKWDKLFKNGPSKICGRRFTKNHYIGGNCLKSEGLGQSADLREAWRKRGGGGDVFDMGMLIPHCTLWIDIEHMQFTHTNQIFKYTYTIKKYKKLSQHIEVKQPNLIHKQKK